MVIRSGRTPAYWVVRPVSGTPWYRPSSPRGPGPCSTVTATLRIIAPSCSGNPSSAATTISSKRSGSTSITSPLSSAAGPAVAAEGRCNRGAGASVITVTRLTEPAQSEGTVMDATLRVARRAIAAAALTSVAALATACGSSSSTATGNGATPSSTAPASTPAAATPTAPATSPAAAAGPASCPTRSLRLKLGATQVAAGSVYTAIDFTNTSNVTCTLYGYPGVSLTTGKPVAQIGKSAAENPATPRQLVTLRPQATANAVLRIVNALNFSKSRCDPQPTHYLKVYPPNQTRSALIPYKTQMCAKPIDILTVDVVKPGAGSS